MSRWSVDVRERRRRRDVAWGAGAPQEVPRDALKHAADLHAIRQRVAAGQLELRAQGDVAVARVAVQQVVRIRLLVAESPEHPLRRRPAEEHRSVREPRVEGHFVPVVPLLLTVVGADDIVDARQGGPADVVHGDEAAVQWAHDSDQRVVAEALQGVGLPGQVVERPVEPARVQLNAGQQLMLHTHGGFDVVHPLDVRIGRDEGADTKVLRHLRKIDLAPSRQIHASEFPLRHIILVQIGPAQIRARQNQRVELIREVDGLRQLVTVDAGLDGRLRVAEQIVDNTEPGREIRPHRHRDRVEAASRYEPSRWRGRRRHFGIEVFPTCAEVDGQTFEGHLVLRKNPQIGVQAVGPFDRRVVHRHRIRQAVSVPLDQVGIPDTRSPVGAPVPLRASLDVV